MQVFIQRRLLLSVPSLLFNRKGVGVECDEVGPTPFVIWRRPAQVGGGQRSVHIAVVQSGSINERIDELCKK